VLEEGAKVAAKKFGFSWQGFEPVLEKDYDEIFARLAAEQFDAAYIASSVFNGQNSERIVELAVASWAKAGLLLSYGQDLNRSTARASNYVDKILRGAKPSELPVEQASGLQLVINLKTAKVLDLAISPALLARADEVIE